MIPIGLGKQGILSLCYIALTSNHM